MEQHRNPLPILWTLFVFLMSINSLCKAKVCETVIDAAFQRVENPRYVILVSGSNFWEFDRFKGKLVKKRVPLSKYWEKAPSDPGFVMATKKDSTYSITFYKDFIYYIFTCDQTIERCVYKGVINMKEIFPDKYFKYIYEAAFYYHRGMPTPVDSIIHQPFLFHIFAKENLDELDCHGRDKVKNITVNILCQRNQVNKEMLPNFYKLKTEKELVLAAEAFFNQTTNVTDFLVVVDRSLRYTVDGRVKSLNIDDLFKCESSYFWATLIIVVLFIQITCVTIFLAVIAIKAKSFSATL